MHVLWAATGNGGKPPKPLEWDPRLLWLFLAIAAALLVGAVVIALFDRWRKRPVSERPSASDQLAQFRVLYEKGTLSPEEFERIRSKLSGELRRDLPRPADPPPGPAPDPPPAAPESPGLGGPGA